MHILKPSYSFCPAEDRLFPKAVSNMYKSLRLIIRHLYSGPLTSPAKLISKKEPRVHVSRRKGTFMPAEVFKQQELTVQVI